MHLSAMMQTLPTLKVVAIAAVAASATFEISVYPAIAQAWTKPQCIDALYKEAKRQGKNPNAVMADTYCGCRVANQSRMSRETADQYCAGRAQESIPKDPAAERYKMLLIEQMMAPRKPTVIERAYDQYMYEQLYRSFPRY